MNTEEIISSGLLESYALGTASHEESVQVEWWVKAYPEVKTELDEIERALENYAHAQAVTPSADLKNKIFSQISNFKPEGNAGLNKQQTSPVRKMFSPWKLLAAASVILLIGSSILNVIYYNKYNEANDAYSSANNELAIKDKQLKETDKNISVVQNKYSVPVALNGLQASPEAAAKVFWMKNTGDVYIDASNLPETPTGMQYQLWGIVDGKPVDGGMIVTTKTGNTYNMQKMKNFGHAEAFAVTLETKGGNPQPKGDMYVMGKL